MKTLITLIAALLISVSAFAQNVGINADGTAPDASAMLDVKSTSKGFLAPRVVSTANVTSPATGLLVYQTGGTPGYYYYNGSAWMQLGIASGASQWTTTSSDIYYNTGKVGIGTTTPLSPLDVRGVASAFNLALNINYDGSTWRQTTTGYGGYLNIDNPTGNIYLLNTGSSVVAGGATTPTIKLTLTPSGNVGIGTTSPTRLLSLSGSQSVISLYNSGTTTWTGLEMLANNGTLLAVIGLDDATGRYGINMKSDGTEDFTITQNGNVGIGTTAPAYKLDISSATGSGRQDMLRILAGSNSTGNGASIVLGSTQTHAGYISGLQTNSNTGDLTFGTQSNGAYAEKMRIVGSNGNVGIGTTTPASKLHIAGADMNNALLFENTSANPGRNYILFKTQGTEQGYIGLGGGATNHMSIAAYGASNNLYFETNSLVRMTILPSGNVGIGTVTPSHPLQMASGAHVTAAGVWTNASDARLKTNVVNTPYGLSTVLKLRPVNYTMVKGGEAQVGFLAQEVQKIVPEVVSGTEGDITKGETLGLSYGNLVPVLTKAIQEQQATIEAQQKQIDELKAQNIALAGELKAEIETLKKAIYGSSVVVSSEK